MARRILTAIRGVGSLAVVIVILVGPPIALVRFVGNPLPSSIPSIDAVTDSLTTRGVSDDAVINTLAVIAWIVWVQLAIAIAAELAAQVRNRPTPQLPALPGFQAVAGNLVAGIVLLGSLLSTSRAEAAPGELPVLHNETPAQIDDTSARTEPAPTPAPPPMPAVPTETYVVERHDSLWSIAETKLGDGKRWSEIRDLNVGRHQPDGYTLTATSDEIRPGWTLVIPVPAGSNKELRTTHQVEPGEHLWKIAENTLAESLGRPPTDAEIDPYWRDLVEQNRATLVDPANPSLIYPGQQIDVPPVPGLAAHADSPSDQEPSAQTSPTPREVESRADINPPPEPPSTASPVTTAPPARPLEAEAPEHRRSTTRPEPDESVAEERSPISPGVLGTAAGGLAAVVAFQIRRRRQNAVARAPIGATAHTTPEHLRDVHRSVVFEADDDTPSEVQAALAEIAEHVGRRYRNPSRPRLIQVGDDHIDVFLSVPDLDAPPGWSVEATGAAWSRPRSEQPSDTSVCPSPLLVTVGRSDLAGPVFCDLEAAGLTVVSGGDEPVAAYIRSVLRELAHSPAELRIVTVGEVPTIEHERVDHAESFDEIAREVLAWGNISAESLAAHKCPSVFVARGTGTAMDGLVPLLLVCDSIPDDERFDELVGLSESGAGIGLLATGAHPGGRGTNLIVTGDGAMIPSLGLSFQSQAIAADTANALDELVDDADTRLHVPDEGVEQVEVQTVDVSSNGAPYEDPDCDLLVRVLGEITVDGCDETLTARQLGLLTFIATHPNCSAEKLEEAIWPDPIEDRRATMHQALSRLRRIVGAPHLPAKSDSGAYRVADTVRTDLDVFERRIEAAKTKPPAEAIDILRGALQLVSGRPFTYPSAAKRSFTWVDAEELMYSTELSIVRVAEELARLCTEAGDADGAAWAARQGLLACPTNAELTCALIRTHLADGDASGARRVFDHHADELERLDLGEPEDVVLELWEQIDSLVAGR